VSRQEPSWRRYLTFWRPAIDRDVDAEIRFHFDEKVADLIARGRTEAEALAEAEMEFGDWKTYRERIREIDHRRDARRDRGLWLDALRADLRLTLRSLRRAPAISLTVIVLLGLGIGANGAVFSMLDRIFLRPPPGIARPVELRRLWGHYKAPPPAQGFTSGAFNYQDMSDMSRAIGPSIALTGFVVDEVRMGGTETSPLLNVASVIGDYFGTLGVRPALGRLFAPQELGVVAPFPLAVVSHRLWTRTFRGDSTIIGREIRLARQPFTVIGVAAAGFDGIDLDAIDVWRPANFQSTGGSDWYRRRDGGDLQVIFRLYGDLDEATLTKRANDGLHSSDNLFAQRTTIELGPIIAARGPKEAEQDSKVALAVGAVTLIVLLIAIANVGNLLLTRALERRREVAVRLALGISRRRLTAQIFIESAVLAVAAGLAATIIGTWGGLLLRAMLMPTTRWADRLFDFRLVLFTFVAALLAGMVAGVLPLMQTRSLDLAASMRGGVREGSGHRSRTRASLIAMQAALSVILLIGAALFLRSLDAIRAVDIGFDAGTTIIARVVSGDRTITTPERDLALRTIRERAAALPGVRAAGLANQAPMAGFSSERFFVPGRDSQPRGIGGGPTFQAVSPEFFEAAGVSIVSGRSFTADDGPGAPSVAVVTRTMARFIWGSANAVGQCFRLEAPTAPCTTVVGVVEDLRLGEVIEPERLQFFLPLAQSESRRAAALIVGAERGSIPAIESELRSIIRQTIPGGIADVTTLASRLEPQFRPWQVGARLFAIFGLLALLVASIGIYSAISYSVSRRSHELGVRMALGAPRGAVARMVVGSGIRVVAAGAVIGIAVAMVLSAPARSLLYETNPRDPAVLLGVAATLLGVAVIAAAQPAWRASRLDPARALRSE
jgi:predicted permease